jgi:hypothetical protein
VKVDLLVISVGGSTSTVSAEVEMSNDGENWSTTGVIATVSTSFPGYNVDQTSGAGELCSQSYARIKLTATAGTACVKSGLLFFQLST